MECTKHLQNASKEYSNRYMYPNILLNVISYFNVLECATLQHRSSNIKTLVNAIWSKVLLCHRGVLPLNMNTRFQHIPTYWNILVTTGIEPPGKFPITFTYTSLFIWVPSLKFICWEQQQCPINFACLSACHLVIRKLCSLASIPGGVSTEALGTSWSSLKMISWCISGSSVPETTRWRSPDLKIGKAASRMIVVIVLMVRQTKRCLGCKRQIGYSLQLRNTVTEYSYTTQSVNAVTQYSYAILLVNTDTQYGRSIQLLNTVTQYSYEVQLLNTFTRYRYSVQLLNTVTHYSCSIQLVKAVTQYS